MPINKKDKEILINSSADKTLNQWYEYFNHQYTKKTIYSFCYHHQKPLKKIQRTDQSERQYHINQDFFKTWSKNMAYVFGLWFAKGEIYNGQIFDITLHQKDKYILKKIAEILGYKGPTFDYVDGQVSRINFSCFTIYSDIVNLGGLKKQDFPDIPKEFLADFIRGYFDGNGDAYKVKGNRMNVSFSCKHKKFLSILLSILREHAGVVGGSYDPSSVSLRFGNKDSLRIGSFIYKDNPELFLLRKKGKFNI